VLLSVQGYATPSTEENVSPQSTGDQFKDTKTTTLVKTAIFNHKNLKSLTDIKVTTKAGVVYLYGTLNSNSELKEVIAAAETVEIKDLNTDGLKVKDSDHFTQDVVDSAKVRGVFLRAAMSEKSFSPTEINEIEVKDSIVYLTVADRKSQNTLKAVSLAKSVSGIKKVEVIELAAKKS